VGGPRVGGPRAIFEDREDPDPGKRYKMITYCPNYYLSYFCGRYPLAAGTGQTSLAQRFRGRTRGDVFLPA